MARQRNNKTPVKLKDALVLNKFLLNLFGASSFDAFSKDLKDSRLEGYDENNVSLLYQEIINRMYSNSLLNKE